jgi:hypothetical protein
MNKTKLIQIGDNTHSHDQLMTCVSLRTMKTIVNRPPKPIPELELDELDIILNFNYY